MSFPFYTRSSSKPIRMKAETHPENKHSSASFATGAFNHCDGSGGDLGHPRSSRKMRIPFLGKRRKSLATLRSSAIAQLDGSLDDRNYGRHGHHKSVSQLANETAARLARSSLGAAGSLSTGNLELCNFDTSPLKLNLGPESETPTKSRPAEARHTMFPSRTTQISTPDKLTTLQNKRCSEKPTKVSFLSRVTSRPSLASRYSSADLKSTSKARSIFRGSEKSRTSSVIPQRKEIIHPLQVSNNQSLGDDKDFFTSPRVAPTPPNLSFASPASSILESPLGPSRSTVTLPSQRQSALFAQTDGRQFPGYCMNTTVASNKHASSPTTIASPASLSPEMALRSPRRHSVSVQRQTASPDANTESFGEFSADISAGSLAARPRGSHVRIGKEKVTISVANMLEAELGVEVGDSEDSSYYDDSYEDSRRFTHQSDRLVQHSPAGNVLRNGSELPPLSPSTDELDLAFKFPKIKGSAKPHCGLEIQSPLSALIAASSGERDSIREVTSAERVQIDALRDATKQEEDSFSSDEQNAEQWQPKATLQPSTSYTQSLGSRSRGVERLDRISEKSVPLQQETPAGVDERKSAASSVIGSAAQLQRDLDVQCARFDKLAGHLLQIIQRHQKEKLQLESQITTLQKEAHRNEREMIALRKLIARNKDRSSQDGWVSRRLIRVASMQSFLSNISANDEEVEMSVAVEMLARAGRRNSLLSPDISRDGRASVDLSPGQTKTKSTIARDLRRSKTMPDLHKLATAIPSSMPSPVPQDTTPDISGLGLGLDFPLPEPLQLPSISSTIMSSVQEATTSASVPALTTAPTAASGLSLMTEPSSKSLATHGSIPLDPKNDDMGTCTGRRMGRSAREKRMAREWLPGGAQNLYRPAVYIQQASTPPNCAVPALPASASYANNLNKALITTSIEKVMKVESPDLEAMFEKLVASTSELLG